MLRSIKNKRASVGRSACIACTTGALITGGHGARILPHSLHERLDVPALGCKERLRTGIAADV